LPYEVHRGETIFTPLTCVSSSVCHLSCLVRAYRCGMAETDATNADVDRAIRDCYQCYADACIEHDVDHAQRALEALRRLVQRESSESRYARERIT
jgi:hypothetical protein